MRRQSAYMALMTKPTLKPVPTEPRPSKEEAMQAVRTLIAWAGDNPDREGLRDTPKRVVNAYKEWFRGYDQDPKDVLSRVFEDVSGYDDMVILREIDVESHCEHHLSLIHISEPTRLRRISYAVFCLKKKK